jgi:phosphinothricin acetyltransferase
VEFITKSGKKITIRPLTKADLEKVYNFFIKLVGEDTFILRAPGDEPTLKEEKKWFDSKLESIKKKKAISLDAFFEESVVGSVSIEVGEYRFKYGGEIGVSIAKDFRGEGLGYKLLVEAEKEAKKLGLKILILNVYGINDIAQGLYKKFGFRKYGNLPKSIQYKGKLVDDLCMYKRIG